MKGQGFNSADKTTPAVADLKGARNLSFWFARSMFDRGRLGKGVAVMQGGAEEVGGDECGSRTGGAGSLKVVSKVIARDLAWFSACDGVIGKGRVRFSDCVSWARPRDAMSRSSIAGARDAPSALPRSKLHRTKRPPSTIRTEPVTYDASSEASQRIG